jgi:predicted peptidase
MQDQAIAALEAATQEFNGDQDRTYLTGLSMGGRGAWFLSVRMPERFAALVIIAGLVTHIAPGWLPAEKETALRENKFLQSDDPYGAVAEKIRSLPIRLFHGSADMAAPVTESRRMTAALQKLGVDVNYTEYPGVPHNSWDKAFAEPSLMPWLLAQRRKTGTN